MSARWLSDLATRHSWIAAKEREDVMYKRVLIGLFVICALALWGTDANAFDRINGILIKHNSIEVEVTLCGNPLQPTQLDLVLAGEGVLECANPSGKVPPGNAGHQTTPFTFERSLPVSSDDFTADGTCDSGNNNDATALITTVFELELECKQKNFTKNSEVVNVEATATWRCLGSGPECPGGAATIEAVQTECPDLEVEEVCNQQGEGDLEHVGPEGAPPPPLESCVDIHLDCDPDSPVLETVCGAGLHTLAMNSANNISYVTLLNTSSVVLHHCNDGSELSDATLEISEDTDLCSLDGGCCGFPRWNDNVCSVEINPSE
jgi:hypothetical protein